MTERISASVAGKHLACPASANLDLAIPNWVPPVVDDMAGAKGLGTRKHEMLEPIVALNAREIGHFAKVLTYMADLRGTRRFKVLIEQEFTATWLTSQPTTKPDVVLFVQDEIHIIDYKWGKIPVDVVNNKQAMYYAVCAAPLAPKAKGVTLHILQPPIDSYESWFVDTNTLAQFMADMQEAERKILKGDTTFGPSDDCKFCPANPHGRGDKGHPYCPAMMDMLYPERFDEDAILSL